MHLIPDSRFRRKKGSGHVQAEAAICADPRFMRCWFMIFSIVRLNILNTIYYYDPLYFPQYHPSVFATCRSIKNQVQRGKMGNGWYSRNDELHKDRRGLGNVRKRRKTHDNCPSVSAMPVLFCLACETSISNGTQPC